MRSRGISRLLPAVIMLTCSHTWSAASAEAPHAPAHERAGTEAYRRGDYRRALDEFRQSYNANHAAGMLFNIAQAHMMLGEDESAIECYRRYLKEASTGRLRVSAENNLRLLERRLNTVRNTSSTSPAPPSATPPNPKPLTARKPLRARARRVEKPHVIDAAPVVSTPVASPTEAPVRLEPLRPPSEPPPPTVRIVEVPKKSDSSTPQAGERDGKWYGGIGFAAGGMLTLVASAFLLAEAERRDEQVKNHLRQAIGGKVLDPYFDIEDQMVQKDRINAASWVSLSLGLASTCLGVYLLTKPNDRRPFTVHVAPSAAGVFIGGTF